MSEFTGFGPKTKKFLRDLGRHNDKGWFDAHRAEYEAYYLEPARAFVEAVGPKLQKVAPNVVWEPRVNGSIFRINRDIRFSKDKTPYKDHIDFWFWEGRSPLGVSRATLQRRPWCCTAPYGQASSGSRHPSSETPSSRRIVYASGRGWPPSTAG